MILSLIDVKNKCLFLKFKRRCPYACLLASSWRMRVAKHQPPLSFLNPDLCIFETCTHTLRPVACISKCGVILHWFCTYVFAAFKSFGSLFFCKRPHSCPRGFCCLLQSKPLFQVVRLLFDDIIFSVINCFIYTSVPLNSFQCESKVIRMNYPGFRT